MRKDLITITLVSSSSEEPVFITMQLSPLYYNDEIIASIFCTHDNRPKNWEVIRITLLSLRRLFPPSNLRKCDPEGNNEQGDKGQ